MKTFFAVLATALTAASYVEAAIPNNTPLHINSHLDSGLALTLANNVPTAFLLVDSPGSSTPSDLSLFNLTAGEQYGQIFHDDLCITANGVTPGNALVVDTCSDDPAQLWWMAESRLTIQNADNNCITLCDEALRAVVLLEACNITIADRQEWKTFVAITRPDL
ncbi:hypothetical protein L226DRAFT_557925 [Lentinus tigrinus ALCF2SS1-7]|uniref:Ricin B lectin domain-containing protein n=1 Tax=Lentinus tigrinus ALCF2SS1-6 TaxID=1328759 RepID=A0A5C2SQB4_9APHY|nr:hypothetical protein L227DRAFT_597831 [Lentinus tigrinus ALCF2SS1-6]RPD79294.1 hypothetical protein L226DRAFT_557925 [Lentinus tigrinus ALCF2SS1-7]